MAVTRRNIALDATCPSPQPRPTRSGPPVRRVRSASRAWDRAISIVRPPTVHGLTGSATEERERASAAGRVTHV
jgi:hypothetical protein